MCTGISIIICCYNSRERIEKTLTFLAQQNTKSELNWEVILVDNASTDHTVGYAKQLWTNLKTKIPLKIIVEDRLGLSYARDTGIQNSTYSYNIFCDDDNWLSEYYLQTSFDLMQSNPQIGALGGHGEEVLEIDPYPEFYHMRSYYAVGIFTSNKNGKINPATQHIYGAGMCIRKKAYLELKTKKFDFILTDRIGNKNTAGGDIELMLAITLLGYEIYFDERLTFKHFIPANRLTLSYPMQRIKDGTPALVFSAYRDCITERPSSKSFYLIKVSKSLIDLLIVMRLKIKNPSYSKQKHLMECIAFSKALLVNYRLYARTRNQARQLKL